MKKGFTLAEVLITLAIIGVVAAMTVPALMTSTRGKEFEVGANKAMSTLANAVTMRYAMDGVEMIDYTGSIMDYLTKLPANPRPGEQPALPIVQENNNYYKIKDGMIIKSTIAVGDSGGSYSSGQSDCKPVVGASRCLFIVDTNGTKGPTRTDVATGHHNADCGITSNGTVYGVDGMGWPIETKADGSPYGGTPSIPQTNECPDIVMFLVSDGKVVPANQRTRNILATGNSMIRE